MLAVLLPRVPLVIRVVIMHLLKLSEPAPYMSLRSELMVSIIRSFLQSSNPFSISAAQELSLRDPGPKGRLWISKYVSPPPPETSIRDALLRVVKDMAEPGEPAPEVRVPEFAHVEAEWNGHREAATKEEALPDMTELERYQELTKECSAPTTILYFHGGAFYTCDPSTHRNTCKRLAKLTGGRCYSVRYRLSPQHAFPAALLDALVSYLTLLYPPPDAFHEPVLPEHVVFAGDR